MNQRFRPLTCCLGLAMLAALTQDAGALAHKQSHAKKADAASGAAHRHSAALKKDKHTAHAATAQHKPANDAAPETAAAPALSGDLAAVKDAIDLMRKAKTTEATATEKTIGDPAAQKLVERFILRHPDGAAPFNRYPAFIADHPGWPRRTSPSSGLVPRSGRTRTRRAPCSTASTPRSGRTWATRFAAFTGWFVTISLPTQPV